MTPRVWVYSLMWNEAMFLPFYLRHYGAFAERIVIYDHHSTDGSREIVQAAGCEVRDYNAPGIHEPSVTALYNTCYHEARGQADWVIIADIDEIIVHPDWPALFVGADRAKARALQCGGYTMMHDMPPVDDGRQIYEGYRLGVRDRTFDKVAVFRPEVNINYDHGRHHAKPDAFPIAPGTLKLLHYRYWGKEWLEMRHMMHAHRMSLDNRLNGWGINKLNDTGEYYTLSWFERMKAQRVAVL